jgi:allantoicase
MSAKTDAAEPWPFWRRYLNWAQPRLGARVLRCNDEFFGAAERLLGAGEPQFIPGKYDEHGKWMDGWETRRRREPGHDWCEVELGAPVRIVGVDIDTTHFNGNQPESARILAALDDANAGEATPADEPDWHELLPRVPLQATSRHRHALQTPQCANRLRLEIFPDGGVARLRVYGVVEHDWTRRCAASGSESQSCDLVAAHNGGFVLAASDEHFGAAANLILPGRGIDMGDGWETARRRGPGSDWAILALGCPGRVERLVIDTAHFKGNFPHQASVQGALLEPTALAGAAPDWGEFSASWPELLTPQFLQMDHEHEYTLLGEVPQPVSVISHVRLNMFPDGGISRLRVFGQPRPQLANPR